MKITFKLILIFSIIILNGCYSMKTPNFYSETKYWKKYNDFLPDDLKYKNSNLPKESYWPWKDYKIHIDKMKGNNSSVKIIILHGAGGNGRIVGIYGNYLNKLGYEYIAPDLIGYGLTKNPKRKNIRYEDWVKCVSDLVDKEFSKDGKKIVLFGLSLVGMLAYQVASKNKNVKGIIVTTLANPRERNVRDDISKNLFISRIGYPFLKITSPVTDHLKLPVRWLSKMDRITNNSSFSKVFSKDKLAGGSKLKLRFLRTFISYKPVVEPENFLNCPVLYLQPEKDTWTTTQTSKPFFDRIKADKKFVLLENCGHAPYEENGLTTLKKEIESFLSKISK